MPIDFENNYKDISETELWKIFRDKCAEEGLPEEFAIAVGKVCEEGVIKSKDIIRFFPNFTLHDITHIKNVCNWMTKLLGDRRNELTAYDAAMLLMSACCHDIGMSVSAEQEKELKEKHPTAAKQRDYVRIHHHERTNKHLTLTLWNQADPDRHLQRNGITRTELLALCKSHGESLDKLKVPNRLNYDLRLCSVLLRLADILDFDASRAPQSLFEHMGLNEPENFEEEISQIEWIKNASGFLNPDDGDLTYTAAYSDPNIEHKVNDYLKWIKQELDDCREFLSKYAGNWNNLRLPYRIIPIIERNGYEGGDFHLTMDQKRILELLSGKNLYSDPCVFVRELLQNAIDAILWRDRNDLNFDAKQDGKIIITTWHDETGQGWFRIEDNGTGMDENIIKNYFLNVGRSYYTSDDFEKERDSIAKDKTYKTYKPISRFGIGILSCFMSGKNNRLEVSTKRYAHDKHGLRLSVTGLTGYYSLAKEGEQEESDWQKMPVRNSEDEEYFRQEPGTTICIGMNLFNLGDHSNIKEVVDKYVQFPDMEVVYCDDIIKDYHYPTKDKFTEAVAALKAEHGDEIPIVCRHPIPDEEFVKLKQYYPEFEWKTTPEIVFHYYPLGSFKSADNLCGISVSVGIDAIPRNANYSFLGDTYKFDLKTECRFENHKSAATIVFTIRAPHTLVDRKDFSDSADFKRISFWYKMTISYPSITALMSESEKTVFQYAVQNHIADGKGITAYNGVFADKIIGYTNRNNTLLLLGGSYAPEVNVARDSITNLPIEAAVELSVIEELIKYRAIFSSYWSSDYLYQTEKELQELIHKHPEWESIIKVYSTYHEKTIEDIRMEVNNKKFIRLGFRKESIHDNIAFTILKKDYDLCCNINLLNFIVLKIKDKPEKSIDTSDFPVQLFFKFFGRQDVFARIVSSEVNCYSSEHPLSRWLIQNRKRLEKEMPEVYKKILETMIKSKDKTHVMNSLNDRLTQLKGYKNNLFRITDELYLTKEDFI